MVIILKAPHALVAPHDALIITIKNALCSHMKVSIVYRCTHFLFK